MEAGLQVVYEGAVVVGAAGLYREGHEALRQDPAHGLQNQRCVPPGQNGEVL